jgi:hypothetical protein
MQSLDLHYPIIHTSYEVFWLTWFKPTAPNALSFMKSKLKGILRRKKKTATEPTKTEELDAKPADAAATTEAAVPTETAAAEAAADPVAAAAR